MARNGGWCRTDRQMDKACAVHAVPNRSPKEPWIELERVDGNYCHAAHVRVPGIQDVIEVGRAHDGRDFHRECICLGDPRLPDLNGCLRSDPGPIPVRWKGGLEGGAEQLVGDVDGHEEQIRTRQDTCRMNPGLENGGRGIRAGIESRCAAGIPAPSR